MSSTVTPTWRKAISGLLTAVLIAAAAIFVVASPSQSAGISAAPLATNVTIPDDPDCELDVVDGGQLVWGVKTSFRNYIVSPIAHGTITPSGGATQAANNGAFTFPNATGWWDADNQVGNIAFDGSVYFSGHGGILELDFSNIRVELFSATEGALFADITGREFVGIVDQGPEFTEVDVRLAEFTPNVQVNDGTLTISVASLALHEDGVDAFGGFYSAGDPLDGFTLTATLSENTACDDTPEPTPTPTETDSPVPTPTPTEIEDPTDPETPVFEPELTVFLSDGVTEYTGQFLFNGDELVVKGSGFDPAANVGGRGVPIPSNLPQGTYVVFGHFAEEWQPSEGAGSGSRKSGDQAWVLTEETVDQIPERYQGSVRAQWVELDAEGNFEATLTAGEPSELVDGGRFGIYSYGAGGVNNADQELEVLVNYAGDPALEVFLSDGETPYTGQEVEDGDELVVKGSGFDPAANVGGRGVPIPSNLPQGTYVVFGHFAEEWQPSEGAGSGSRKSGDQAWVLTEETVDQIPERYQGSVRAQWVELDAEGNFEATLTAGEPSELVDGGRFGIYSYGAGGVNNADQELEVLVNFVTEDDSEEPEPTPTPTPEPTPDPTDPVCDFKGFDSGILTWGIRESFRDYIVGNIARGNVVLSPGVTQAPGNGPFTFNQISGWWDEEANTGVAAFGGSIRFEGHGGEMDLLYANPTIELTSATEGKVILDVRGTSYPDGDDMRADRVVFAEFTASVTVNGDNVQVNGTNVVLTEDGSAAFSGMYAPGTELDDIAFSARLGTLTDCDTDTEPGLPDPDSTPKVEFKVDGRNTNTVHPGELISITASGFQPGESVLVTVYSDPIHVGTFRASANGTVTFDWTVPLTIAEGAHRMVLVGSETGAVEFRFTVASQTSGGNDDDDTTPVTEEEPVCVARAVNGATLSWGVKTSFREYITGPIANGSISTSGVSQSGSQFNWGGGSGAFNTDANRGRVSFSGSVQFSGHGGLLDLRISNPRIQITGPNNAQLIADVVSKGYNGSPDVNSSGVVFANLRLSGGQVSGNQVRYTNVPATLTGAGAQAFAGFYNAGDVLDSVSFTLPLGGEVDCDASTGTLASTGADGDRMIFAAAALMFLGAGLVVARRKFVTKPVEAKATN